MTLGRNRAFRRGGSLLAMALIAGGTGYWIGHRSEASAPAATASADGQKVLYYYDPMFPNQKFGKPGKSPFMDMQLVPKYADGSGAAGPAGVSIDPAARQSLGMRVVAAKTGTLASSLDVAGTVDFNQRDVAIVQAGSSAGSMPARRATWFAPVHRSPICCCPIGAVRRPSI